MKKLIILITAMFIILLTSACGKVENTESSVVITDADAKYIELVYDNIENWDVTRMIAEKHFQSTKSAFIILPTENKWHFTSITQSEVIMDAVIILMLTMVQWRK